MNSDATPLCDLAVKIIREVLAEGDSQHPGRDWVEPHRHNSVCHAEDHLTAYWTTASDVLGAEYHELSHALCRIAMALWKLKEGEK